MANSANSLGMGFNEGITRGLQYGHQMALQQEMRKQQLADRAQALQLDAEIRAAAQARDDARYRDQQAYQARAEANTLRRLDMQAPAASLAFLRADAQGGPLAAADAAREQALAPLAFQEVQREEEARRRQAEIDAAAAAERAARTGYYHERAGNERAGKLGTAAAAFVDNSRLGQAMREIMSRKPERPEMEDVVLERDPETGEMVPVKITRKQPAGAAPAASASRVPVNPLIEKYVNGLATKEQQEIEAQRKKLAEERQRLEAEAEKARQNNAARALERGPMRMGY